MFKNFLIIVCLPVVLLAWKMESSSAILPATTAGSSTWQTIDLQQTYDTIPLIFALVDQGSGYSGDSPVALRVRNVTNKDFEIVQVEPQSMVSGKVEGQHSSVSIHYIAIEAGDYTLSDGTHIIASTIETSEFRGKNASGSEGWASASYSSNFSSTPMATAMIQSLNNEASTLPGASSSPWMTVAIGDLKKDSVKIALDRAETSTSTISAKETIGYLVIDTDIQSILYDTTCHKIDYETISTSSSIKGWDNGCYSKNFNNTYLDSPLVIGSMNTRKGGDGGWLRRCSLSNTQVGITVDEDQAQAQNEERSHTSEIAGLAIFQKSFAYDSSKVTDCTQANNDYVYGVIDTPYTGNLLNNDEGAGISVTSNTSPSHGSLSGVNPDGSYTYTPDSGYSGIDAFEYTLTDSSSMSYTATVYITIETPIDRDATLIANYRFDACSFGSSGDDVVDNTLNNLTGSAVNGTSQVTGQICKAAEFDGADDYIEVPHDEKMNFDGGFSVSFWVYMTGSRGTLVSKMSSTSIYGNGWDFEVYLAGHVDFDFNGWSNYIRSSQMSSNAWHHVVGVYDPTTPNELILYIDGTKDTDSSQNTALRNATTTPLTIGWGVWDHHYQGALDEVKLFDRALSATAVATLYSNESNSRNWNNDSASRVCNTCQCRAVANASTLVSFPIDFRNMSSGKDIDTLLGGDFVGTYGVYWKLYSRIYDITTSNKASYHAMLETEELEFGKAYWIINTTSNDVDYSVDQKRVEFDATVDSYSSCRSVNGKCILVDLVEPNGTDNGGAYIYTMASLPLSKSVKWRDVRVLIDGVSYTPNDAQSLGETFNATIWRYDQDGTNYMSIAPNTPGILDSIDPCKGYLVELDKNSARKDVQLLIPQESR